MLDIRLLAKTFHATGISSDSRQIQEGDIFVAIRGHNTNANVYIDEAFSKGCACVITDDASIQKKGVILVENARKALAEAADYFYPRKPEFLYAVTGTNGKTSTTDFIRQFYTLLGISAASIGTLGVIKGNDDGILQNGVLTTPDAITLRKALHELALAGARACAIEASSIGLHQYRLHKLTFDSVGFTNLSQDHLDYHTDITSYLEAKQSLINYLKPGGIVCYSPTWEEAIRQNARRVESILVHGVGEFSIVVDDIRYRTHTTLLGDFQIHNICLAILMLSNVFDVSELIDLVPRLSAPRGRMQQVGASSIFVDYAHTPDALAKALKCVRAYTTGRVIVVFGCGGDRDKTKRALMGNIADTLADVVIITNDNPRSEDPDKIVHDIASRKATVILDRREAIFYAIRIAQSGDLILIAGKGHEQYQIIGADKAYFCDVQVANEALRC